jgi:NADH:ubiquinone oxidoreductase subunit F (NADH-binding)
MPDVARQTSRVLPAEPFQTLDDYDAAGGGRGLEAALAVEPGIIIEELVASGLRGRGGAGFPTGVKWRTIQSFASPVLRTSIVVNAAEGEPGTFKDRTILRANPYAVIEGALIAARAVDAGSITIATKADFTEEIRRVRQAIEEMTAAGMIEVEIDIVEGPSEYLYGEETALLEVIDGRPPFPRVAPPYRRGIDEVVESDADVDSGSGLPANVEMAATDSSSAAPPVLVNNVETMANVPEIIARGAAWFRSVGTEKSPGTIVCTITGDVRHPGVVEVPMGTRLSEAIDVIAGGPHPEREIKAVLVGVSSAVLTPAQLDVELTYEGMAAIGSGLGSAGYIVIDDATDAVSVAAGASRYLAVESCGQCTPCKQDGAEISAKLAAIAAGSGEPADLDAIRTRLGTIVDGARCSLAAQHQAVVGSLLRSFEPEFTKQCQLGVTPVEVRLVSALLDVTAEAARFDETFAGKQLDWTYADIDSGKSPVERFTDHRAEPEPLDAAAE